MLPKGLGNLGDLSNMVKQAMAMKGKIEELKASLGDQRVEASAGGGMVKVVFTGTFEMVSIDIEPEVLAENDKEMVETMVRAAVNEGIREVQEMVREKMRELTGGLDIPGLV